ncbi:hypothetical protein U9M48_001214 [Paspalum notatum var. saurae]|uniref:Uncharacterized protein n=1 Tax=Paspalum notatum var. saurae TaxID=547442 RepID=A0AAQ3SGI0_PASNO
MEASLQGATFTRMASLPCSPHARARGHAVLPTLTARDAARHLQERPCRRERTLKPIQTTAAELWLNAARAQTTRSTNVLCTLVRSEKHSEDPDEYDYFDTTRGHHSDTSLLQIL